MTEKASWDACWEQNLCCSPAFSETLIPACWKRQHREDVSFQIACFLFLKTVIFWVPRLKRTKNWVCVRGRHIGDVAEVA